MNAQIQKFTDIVQQFKVGILSADQVEDLYGTETMDRIMEHMYEDYCPTY